MASDDTARVIAPPPLLLVVALVLGGLLDGFVPLDVLGGVPMALRYAGGGALVLAALGLALPAAVHFRRVGTAVKPWKPTTRLVTTGVMGRLRNPMYVGMVLLVWGLALLTAGDWLLLSSLPLTALLHWGVVLPEEAYLRSRFGDSYRRYQEAVPRYGLPGPWNR